MRGVPVSEVVDDVEDLGLVIALGEIDGPWYGLREDIHVGLMLRTMAMLWGTDAPRNLSDYVPTWSREKESSGQVDSATGLEMMASIYRSAFASQSPQEISSAA